MNNSELLDKRNSKPYIMVFSIGTYSRFYAVSLKHQISTILISDFQKLMCVCTSICCLLHARICRLLNSLKVQLTLLSIQVGIKSHIFWVIGSTQNLKWTRVVACYVINLREKMNYHEKPKNTNWYPLASYKILLGEMLWSRVDLNGLVTSIQSVRHGCSYCSVPGVSQDRTNVGKANLSHRLLQIQHVVLVQKWLGALHQSEQHWG